LENSDAPESQPWERPFVPKSSAPRPPRLASAPSIVPSLFSPSRSRSPSPLPLIPSLYLFPPQPRRSSLASNVAAALLFLPAWSLPTQFLTATFSRGFPLSCGSRLPSKLFSYAMYFLGFSLARSTAELGPCSKLYEDSFRGARAPGPEGLPRKRVCLAPVSPPFDLRRSCRHTLRPFCLHPISRSPHPFTSTVGPSSLRSFTQLHTDPAPGYLQTHLSLFSSTSACPSGPRCSYNVHGSPDCSSHLRPGAFLPSSSHLPRRFYGKPLRSTCQPSFSYAIVSHTPAWCPSLRSQPTET